MKKKKIILAVVLIAMLSSAYRLVDDIITRLGMDQKYAQYTILNNMIGRFDSGPMEGGVPDGPSMSVYNQLQSFRIPYAKLLVNTINGDKAGAAQELCEYIKKYVNSEEFMTDYNRQREDAMPLTDKGMSLSSLKRNIEVYTKNIKNYPTDTKYIAEQQQLMEADQKRIDALMEASKKTFPNKEIWEKTYPADPSLIVKKRLQEYIQLVATVDFSAKLTGTGKKQTFVNPVYEKKSLKWKAIYRAGKEVNDVVTAFVKDWLKGEIISAVKTKMAENATTPAIKTPVAGNLSNSANPLSPVTRKQLTRRK